MPTKLRQSVDESSDQAYLRTSCAASRGRFIFVCVVFKLQLPFCSVGFIAFSQLNKTFITSCSFGEAPIRFALRLSWCEEKGITVWPWLTSWVADESSSSSIICRHDSRHWNQFIRKLPLLTIGLASIKVYTFRQLTATARTTFFLLSSLQLLLTVALLLRNFSKVLTLWI